MVIQKGKDRLSERFWENVTVTLVKQKRSFVWLEENAGIPNNLSRSSKSGRRSVRLSMALRIAKILDVDLEKLIRYEYRLEEVDR